MKYEAILDKDQETGKFWVWVGAFTGKADQWGEEFSTRLCQKRKAALDRARAMANALGCDVEWDALVDRTVAGGAGA
jgi:hypothetical protein